MAVAGMALMGAAAVTQVVGGVRAKNAANQNAEVLRLQARQEDKAFDIEARQARRRNRTLLAKQESQYGKAGVQMTGSARQVAEMTAQEQEKELLMKKYNSKVRQAGLQGEARQVKRRGTDLLIGSVGKSLGTAGSIIRMAK